MIPVHLKEKKQRLVATFKKIDALMVAFSGGVDSTFLLAVAHEVLHENLVAVTAESPVHPRREKLAAATQARALGVRHIVLQSREMRQPDFVANPPDRCYICKKYLFEDLLKLAHQIQIRHVAHGANTDDLEDFRPGLAAAREMGILAPMVDAGLTKDDIRMLSKAMNLKTWNAPPLACLATRIPYGTPLTEQALAMVDQAEETLLNLGFESCRVRLHGKMARIELDSEDFESILNQKIRSAVVSRFREIGFSHIAIDLEGYVQGNMNRTIRANPNFSYKQSNLLGGKNGTDHFERKPDSYRR